LGWEVSSDEVRFRFHAFEEINTVNGMQSQWRFNTPTHPHELDRRDGPEEINPYSGFPGFRP